MIKRDVTIGLHHSTSQNNLGLFDLRDPQNAGIAKIQDCSLWMGMAWIRVQDQDCVFDVIGKTDEFLKYSQVGVDAGFPILLNVAQQLRPSSLLQEKSFLEEDDGEADSAKSEIMVASLVTL